MICINEIIVVYNCLSLTTEKLITRYNRSKLTSFFFLELETITLCLRHVGSNDANRNLLKNDFEIARKIENVLPLSASGPAEIQQNTNLFRYRRDERSSRPFRINE